MDNNNWSSSSLAAAQQTVLQANKALDSGELGPAKSKTRAQL